MATQPRVYPIVFASGVTSTTSVLVGNYDKLYMYHSGTTAFNSGTGNITFRLRGSIGSGTTSFQILSALIQTDTSGGIYNFPVNCAGIPYLSFEFGTAVTGSATNTIYLIAADNS